MGSRPPGPQAEVSPDSALEGPVWPAWRPGTPGPFPRSLSPLLFCRAPVAIPSPPPRAPPLTPPAPEFPPTSFHPLASQESVSPGRGPCPGPAFAVRMAGSGLGPRRGWYRRPRRRAPPFSLTRVRSGGVPLGGGERTVTAPPPRECLLHFHPVPANLSSSVCPSSVSGCISPPTRWDGTAAAAGTPLCRSSSVLIIFLVSCGRRALFIDWSSPELVWKLSALFLF